MKRSIREPLVQFLALGAVLFAIGLLRDDGGTAALNDRITITPCHIDRFIAGFEMTRQRPPTPGELDRGDRTALSGLDLVVLTRA